MARLIPEQDLVVRVGLQMDYEGTEATACAIRAQAQAYRRMADRMDQAASDIFASVAKHRADVAESEPELVQEGKLEVGHCADAWGHAGHDPATWTGERHEAHEWIGSTGASVHCPGWPPEWVQEGVDSGA